ncbi:centromere protein C [Carlito syrichta]|uniref:Centromere protein C n=1 Tax=Carlito syrichta TaxID=1868482 RepID=A0A3Q0EGN8_CARSF|nr:centromere protein C [Carlito syrichta]
MTTVCCQAHTLSFPMPLPSKELFAFDGRPWCDAGRNHLKNGYRRRFCRPSRAPDINTEQGQNILEILQDCFEEKSLANDFSTNSTKSMVYSTPQIKDICIQSPSKECQKSQSNSVPVSSKKKEAASLQFVVEPSAKAASRSVQACEIQKILEIDVGSKNKPDSKEEPSKKLSVHHREAEQEFYLSVGSPSVLLDAKTSISQNVLPPIAQEREAYTFGNSVNMLSSSMQSSLKTKKRLNFEDKVILGKVEIENEVSEEEDNISEGQQERKLSGTSQKRMQDSEYEIRPQARKSFSTLFLETVKRKGESSPIVRHTAAAPLNSSPSSNMKSIEDEFVIDESDRSFSSRSWIAIPRKTGHVKQHTVSSAESTALLQDKKSQEKHHHASPKTLASDTHSRKPHPVEKSQPSDKNKLSTSCALTDEVEDDCRATKYKMYSDNAAKLSGSKRTVKQNQRRKFKTNVVEKQLSVGQSKGENTNMSHITQDTFQRNLDRNMEEGKELRNDTIANKQMPSVGSKKGSTRKGKEELKKKCFSSESKKNKFVPEEVTSTITRSRRISRRPSNWWVVKSEESHVYNGSSQIRNESSVHLNSRQKPAKKTNQSSKIIGQKKIPVKRQKAATQGSSRLQKFSSAKGSEDAIGQGKISSCSQNEPLQSDKADLTKKKNLDCSRSTGSSEHQDGTMTAQNVNPKTTTSGRIPTESKLYSEESKTSMLEESGPSRLNNYILSGKNNSDVEDEEILESSDDSKRSNVIPKNRMHHKLVLPSNTPNVRRTKRIRLKPLEYWRGERIDYQETPSGGYVIGGILSPDTVLPKRKAKENIEKVKKGKKICLDNDERKTRLIVNLDIPLGDPLQPSRVKDPETKEIILMDLIRPRDTYQFFVKHGELKVYKSLDTPLFSTGKLILGPHQEKGKQHVGRDILVFFVNFGDLLCTLHETPYIITTGDFFYVPSGNYYNIKNLLNEESVLLFTQIKR